MKVTAFCSSDKRVLKFESESEDTMSLDGIESFDVLNLFYLFRT